jgi:hypothetical protein
MPPQNPFLITISIGTATVLIALHSYCLWRGFSNGVMVLYSTWAGRGRVLKIYRSENPIIYWLLFSFWLLLIPVVLYVMIHQVNNLLNGTSG